MTYYDAALQVLRTARRPLTTKEITDRALEQGLIVPQGRTPQATMSAELYRHLRADEKLIKVADPGASRAMRGSVRWKVRSH